MESFSSILASSGNTAAFQYYKCIGGIYKDLLAGLKLFGFQYYKCIGGIALTALRPGNVRKCFNTTNVSVEW